MTNQRLFLCQIGQSDSFLCVKSYSSVKRNNQSSTKIRVNSNSFELFVAVILLHPIFQTTVNHVMSRTTTPPGVLWNNPIRLCQIDFLSVQHRSVCPTEVTQQLSINPVAIHTCCHRVLTLVRNRRYWLQTQSFVV